MNNKLSKRLQGESIIFLENFLQKKRKKSLSKIKIKKIKALLEIKRKETVEMSKKIIESPLFKLAHIQLIRERKLIKMDWNDRAIYTTCPIETMIKMIEIINLTNKHNVMEELNEYCFRKI